MRSPPRVVFVNSFFYPDTSATSQILSDVAFGLARPADVTVITSRSVYDRVSLLPPAEVVNGVRIIRVWGPRDARTRSGRIKRYLAMYVLGSLAVLRHARRGDLVIAKTDPPLLSVPVALAAWLRGALLITWLQDIYPDVARELGVGFARGWSGKLLEVLRNWSLRRSAAVVAIGDVMAERIRGYDIDPNRVSVIPNFTDDEAIVPIVGENSLRIEWGLSDRFVVGYSGNLGRAHDIETILGAAEHLRSHPHICFLFIGGGSLSNELCKQAAARNLSNLVFKPYQPREALVRSLAVPDVHWLTLRPALEGLIVPSKLYGILAAGKPLIAIVDDGGEIGRLAWKYDFGEVIRPGDAAGFVATILALAHAPGRGRAMGINARAYIDAGHTRAAALGKWRHLIETLSNGGPVKVSTHSPSECHRRLG